MLSNKRGLLRTLIAATAGCGCACGCDKSDLSCIHEPSSSRPEITIHYCQPNSWSHTPSTRATSSDQRKGSSPMSDHDQDLRGSFSVNLNTVHQGNKLLIDSMAVEKESEDPYGDFRKSMLQMMFEKEISAEGDLQELLACFLALNSPCHHQLILQAFTQICQEAFPEQRILQPADP